MSERLTAIRNELLGSVYRPDRFHLLRPLPDPIAFGGRDIGRVLFGKDDPKAAKAAYFLLEQYAEPTIPSHKVGARWALRHSSWNAKVWMDETKVWRDPEQQMLARTHIVLSTLLPLLVELSLGTIRPEQSLRLAHGADEAILVIQQLLRVKV